jgi:sugar lactone lactonase YvrE
MHPIRCTIPFLVLLIPLTTVRSAELQYPLSIAVTKSGDAFVADRNLPGIWKVQNNVCQLLIQASPTFRTPLNAIRCVALDGQGNLLAGDSSTRDIYRIDEQGQPQGLTQKPLPPEGANGKRKPVIAGQIGIPMDIAAGPNGDLFVSDLELHRIVKVPSQGGDAAVFASVPAPRGIGFDSQGNLWVVSGRQLVKLSASGEKTVVVPDGVFEFPHAVALATDQTAYVSDGYAKAIWRIPAGEKPAKWVSGPPLVNPVGIRFASDKLHVVDPRAKAIFQITLEGQVTTIILKSDEKEKQKP